MVTGDIEITSTPPDAELVLEVLSLCPQCAEFLEFSFNSSTQTAIVRTKKPLDTEALTEVRKHIFQSYFDMIMFKLMFKSYHDSAVW